MSASSNMFLSAITKQTQRDVIGCTRSIMFLSAIAKQTQRDVIGCLRPMRLNIHERQHPIPGVCFQLDPIACASGSTALIDEDDTGSHNKFMKKKRHREIDGIASLKPALECEPKSCYNLSIDQDACTLIMKLLTSH